MSVEYCSHALEAGRRKASDANFQRIARVHSDLFSKQVDRSGEGICFHDSGLTNGLGAGTDRELKLGQCVPPCWRRGVIHRNRKKCAGDGLRGAMPCGRWLTGRHALRAMAHGAPRPAGTGSRGRSARCACDRYGALASLADGYGVRESDDVPRTVRDTLCACGIPETSRSSSLRCTWRN